MALNSYVRGEKMRKMDSSSHLILNRTSKQEIAEGVTVITRGEGVYVFDQDEKRYIDRPRFWRLPTGPCGVRA